MIPELSIKLDFLQERKNPAEVFEAMALYINAYRDFGQLLTASVGMKVDFEFQLNDIEKGSILSWLSVIPGRVEHIFEMACYSSGKELFRNLTDTDETETEEDVELLAANIEGSLSGSLSSLIVDPHIDRNGLAVVLDKFSTANKKMKSGESVIVNDGREKSQECRVNTEWQFTGNPKEMFQGTTKNQKYEDYLYVKVSVNEGNSVWSFRSKTCDKSFNARIANKEWLQKYQSGLIPAIGPKDQVLAKISLDLYTPPKGKGEPKIRNAKILEIISISRFNGYQYELGAY